MKKWTRAEIEKHLWSDPNDVCGGFYSKELAIHYLEIINTILSEKKLHHQINFLKLINGKFWEPILVKMHTGTYIADHGNVFDDFLRVIAKEFSVGRFRNDFKFQELDPKGEYTYKEAAEYCQCSLKTIETAVHDKKLEKVKVDEKVKKRGRKYLLWGWSINDFKKNKK